MTDLSILLAKIRTLSKRRIAEVEDFVDFLALRGAARTPKPPLTLEERMDAIDVRNRRGLAHPSSST